MPEHVVVVAAVVERDGWFLVTRRLAGTHLAGRWEFPGGKKHPGESDETALQREMWEELHTSVAHPRLILTTSHAYPERIVELRFYRGELTREPVPQLGQALRWVERDELGSLDFPPADAELVDGLVHARL